MTTREMESRRCKSGKSALAIVGFVHGRIGVHWKSLKRRSEARRKSPLPHGGTPNERRCSQSDYEPLEPVEALQCCPVNPNDFKQWLLAYCPVSSAHCSNLGVYKGKESAGYIYIYIYTFIYKYMHLYTYSYIPYQSRICFSLQFFLAETRAVPYEPARPPVRV